MSVRSYQDLTVWQKAMDLAALCYQITKGMPQEERYGMVSQIRRAAASVPANIAEGWGRQQTGEYIRFLQIAQGSLREVETHLLLCIRVGLLTEAQARAALQLITEISKMTRSLTGSLKRKLT